MKREILEIVGALEIWVDKVVGKTIEILAVKIFIPYRNSFVFQNRQSVFILNLVLDS